MSWGAAISGAANAGGGASKIGPKDEPEAWSQRARSPLRTKGTNNDRPCRNRVYLAQVLSDGKPNDLDEYEGRYGVGDLRRAVAEASLQGLQCFCLTVDRHAPGYLHQVFGPGRYAVLRHPEGLLGLPPVPTVTSRARDCVGSRSRPPLGVRSDRRRARWPLR